MAYQDTIGLMPLYGGIDTKTDPKYVDPSNMLVAQNATWPAINQVKKRFGLTNFGNYIVGSDVTIEKATSFGSYINELLLFDGNTLFAYSSSLNRWIDRASLNQIELDTVPIAASDVPLQNPSSAIANGLELVAWDDGTSIFYTVKDNNTNVTLLPITLLAPGVQPKVVASGEWFYLVFASGNQLLAKSFPIANPTAVETNPFTITTYFPGSTWTITVAPNLVLISETPDGTTLRTFARNANRFLTSTGVTTSTAGALTTNSIICDNAPAPSVTSTGWVFTVVMTGETGAPPVYKIYRTSFIDGSVTNTTNSLVYPTTDLPVGGVSGSIAVAGTLVFNPIIPGDDSYSIYLGWNMIPTDTSLGQIPVISLVNYESNLPVPISTYCGLKLFSKAAVQNGEPIVVARTPSLSPANIAYFTWTYFLMRNNTPAFRFLGDLGASGTQNQFLRPLNVLPNDVYEVALEYVTEIDTTINDQFYSDTAIMSAQFTFPAQGIATILPFGATAVIACGNLYSYDGNSVVESGYWESPTAIGITANTGGGSLSAGTYFYQVTYEWTDAANNLHQSAPSSQLTATFGAAGGSTTLVIPTLQVTRRTNVSIVIYRGQVNGEAPLTEVASIPNNVANSTVSFTDTLSDIAIQSARPLYSNGGLAELENDCPPPVRIITATKNRIFLMAQDQPFQMWYSKPYEIGYPADFSAAFTMPIETVGGEVTALGYLDTNAVLFKAERVYFLPGDGPDATGQPTNGFQAFQIISTVTGCTVPPSLLYTSMGLMFQSPTCMTLLDRNQNFNQNIGLPVQGLNGLTIMGAAAVADQNQLRWITSEGTALVYDYILTRWATFSNYDGVGCLTTPTGQFIMARSNGFVSYEDETTFLDSGATPVQLVLGTPWIKPGSQSQGFMVFWEAMILGTFESPHTLSIDVYYDYHDYPSYTYSWDPSGRVNVSVYGESTPYGEEAFYGSTEQYSPQYQPRIMPRKQICQAIRFQIMDSSITGESCTLNELQVRYGNIGGAARLPAKQTV